MASAGVEYLGLVGIADIVEAHCTVAIWIYVYVSGSYSLSYWEQMGVRTIGTDYMQRWDIDDQVAAVTQNERIVSSDGRPSSEE